MLLLRLWRWRTTLHYEMPSLPDSHRVQLSGFAFVVASRASKLMLLCLSDFLWSSRFLKPKWTFLNYLAIVLWSTAPPHLVPQMFLLFFCDVITLVELVEHCLEKGYRPSTNCLQISIDFPICRSSRLSNRAYMNNGKLQSLDLMQPCYFEVSSVSLN